MYLLRHKCLEIVRAFRTELRPPSRIFFAGGGRGHFEIVNVQIHVHAKQMGIVGMQNMPHPEIKGKKLLA